MPPVANGMFAGQHRGSGTYLQGKQPDLTFGLDSLLRGWACMLSDSTKVGWAYIDDALA